MKIAVCYVVVTQGPISADYASRFVATYNAFPPQYEHDTYICCNGGPLSRELGLILASLNPQYFLRSNDAGWDISGYIDLARGPCFNHDAMLCLGESCHFHREGWLRRFAEAWQKYGVGMYGPFASNTIRGHLNTTAFFCAPKLLREYPVKIQTRKDRYEFEHGQRALWRRISARGMPVRMVTWDGEWEPRAWRLPPNILWRGDQSNCLLWCNHSERFAESDTRTKLNWLRTCDQPFK